MIGPVWLHLLRHVPVAHHESLVLTMTNNAEVIVQSIVRFEMYYVILRGRTAGSLDAGRLMVVPYDQIHFVGFKKTMTDAEVHEIFGAMDTSWLAALAQTAQTGSAPAGLPLPPMPPQEVAAAVASAVAAAPLVSEHPNAEPPRAPDASQLTPKPNAPSKSMLLARLRARLANDSSKPAQ